MVRIRETFQRPAALTAVPGQRVCRAMARAVAGGALGAGWIVRESEGGVTWEDAAGRRQGALRLDGQRVVAEAMVGEARRIAQGVVSAATGASVATLVFGWPWWWALPAGVALGAGWTLAGLRGDARALRGCLRALAENLALFVAGGGEQPGEAGGVHPQP